jgi:hypothetical protein
VKGKSGVSPGIGEAVNKKGRGENHVLGICDLPITKNELEYFEG